MSDRTLDNGFAAVDREARLLRKVSSRMVSDFLLGAFLSGGIDSSLIVALLQAASTRLVKTFRAAFQEADYHEANHARAVAKHWRSDHTELPITPSEAITVIPRLAGASQIPTMLICALDAACGASPPLGRGSSPPRPPRRGGLPRSNRRRTKVDRASFRPVRLDVSPLGRSHVPVVAERPAHASGAVSLYRRALLAPSVDIVGAHHRRSGSLVSCN